MLGRAEPETVDLLLDIVRNAGDDDEAQTLAVQELDATPEGTNRFQTLVTDAIDEGRVAEGLRLLDLALPVMEDTLFIRWLRAFALAALDQLPLALDEMDRVVEQVPRMASALAMRTDILFRLDREEDGLEALEEAVRRQPDAADIHLEMGRWAYAAGRLEKSIAAYRRSLELEPDAVAALTGLGLALLATGDETSAAKSYEEAVAHLHRIDVEEAGSVLELAMQDLDELAQERPDTEATRPIRTLLERAREAAQRPTA